MTSDDLRARLEAALRGIKFGLGTNTRYGLSGDEVEEATEQLLTFVEAELARRVSLTDGDEVVRCHGLHCLNTEFYARLEPRGWLNGAMGTWLCPDCKPITKE